MRCDTALDRMLEAEPSELRGVGDGELAAHIAACGRCSRIAATLLDELGALDSALAGFGKRHDADAAADAALAAVRGGVGAGRAPGPPARDGARVGPGWRTWTRGAWVPLAAAAALAAVLLARDDAPVDGPVRRAPGVEPRVSVTPPEDQGAAILETANPNITIVWLYEREES